ncbi:MAG TPA: thiol reductant ABC exporter subunit CydD [Pseudonocardiaceae bacterium]
MTALDRRLLRQGRAGRAFLAVSVLLGLGTAACVLAQALLLAWVIAAVFLGGAGAGAVAPALVALLGVVGVRAGLAYAQEVAAARASAAVKSRLRTALLRRSVDLGPEWLAGRRTGPLTQLATGGVDAIDPYFARYLPQLVLACVVTPLFVTCIWLADWLSGLVVLLTVPLVPVFMALVGLATGRQVARQWRTLERLAGHFLDVVDGLATLRVFGRAGAQQRSLAAVTADYRRATMRVLRTSFLSSFVLELATSLAVALVAVQIGLRLVGGTVELQPALVVLLLAPEAYLPLRQVGANHHAAAEGLAAARRVFEVLDVPVASRGTNGTGAGAVPRVAASGLVVNGVSVTRVPGEPPTLPPTSLRVAPGEVVAVVGRSGAGKSTLLSVLLGFLSPSAGSVLVGDVTLIGAGHVSGADLARWRADVAWVPQRPALLAGTVADNVRCGDDEASDDEVRRALARAAAAELSPSLVLGEQGAGLSAGQRQRVALARAFLRAERGAGLLMLDEPTAHLDSATEARVLAGIRELAAAGRCVLLVVHRPALAAAADRVVPIGTAVPTTAPTEATPIDAVPIEAVPIEAAPIEAAPAEAVPTEAVPTEAAAGVG